MVGFSRKCVHLCKSSCTDFFTTLYLSVILLVVAVTETSITHHAGELTLHCLSLSLSSQLRLNLAYIIASDGNGGIGIPPTQRRTGHHRNLSNLGHGNSCHGHNWTATPLPRRIRTWQGFSQGKRKCTLWSQVVRWI